MRFRYALIGVLALTLSHRAPAQTLPRLETNQSYIEQALAPAILDVGNPKAMFDYVLGSLPDRVIVYPTENYFYFNFIHRHVRYAGNIRLDVVDRDAGKIHFAYFEDLAEWKDQPPITHVIFDAAQGVRTEKLGALVYRITSGAKSVVFELNDLSKARPPAQALGPDETFIGPIFDESAIRFFLVFNRRLKVFHYILDETVGVADQFNPLPAADRLLIGKRTGFAFYRDHQLDRKILIGVFEGNSRVNNQFDGPFDQLPDNFIEGETLREAILAVEPQLKGRIDRFGISPGGEDRYLIAPYRHYRTEDDLMIFHECATDKKIPAANYYECFVFEDGPMIEPPAPPKKPKKQARRNAGARKNVQ